MNPLYAEMAQTIETELVQHGYVLSMGSAHSTPPKTEPISARSMIVAWPA